MKRFHTYVLCTIAGVVGGYLVLHPYAMVAYWLTSADQFSDLAQGWNALSVRTSAAFRPFMFPMAVVFASLGGVIGFLVALLVERKRKLDATAHESEKNRAALEAVKNVMVTLSHYLLNANMIIGGKVRHCRKVTSHQDILDALDVVEEQGRKIDAVVNALRTVVEIKTTAYTSDGRISMIDVSREVEDLLQQSREESGRR